MVAVVFCRQVAWHATGGNEKFYFDQANVSPLHSELSQVMSGNGQIDLIFIGLRPMIS